MSKNETAQVAPANETVITRDVILNGTVEDGRNILEADLVGYAEELSGKTTEELKAAEAELMEVFKENDEYIKHRTYKLTDSIEYDGNKYSANEIHRKIIGFLNKLEVEFRATLGIYQAIRAWKNIKGNEVPYPVFDTTLRLLGTLKYRGESECLDILVINNFFASAHQDYMKDTMWLEYLSTKHNTILQSMEKPEDVVGDAGAAQPGE